MLQSNESAGWKRDFAVLLDMDCRESVRKYFFVESLSIASSNNTKRWWMSGIYPLFKTQINSIKDEAWHHLEKHLVVQLHVTLEQLLLNKSWSPESFSLSFLKLRFCCFEAEVLVRWIIFRRIWIPYSGGVGCETHFAFFRRDNRPAIKIRPFLVRKRRGGGEFWIIDRNGCLTFAVSGNRKDAFHELKKLRGFGTGRGAQLLTLSLASSKSFSWKTEIPWKD